MARTAAGEDATTAVPPSHVDRRRARARGAILDAARDLARRDGIAGLSMRDLAAEVGMKAPSLYSYFGSKAAIYDTLFAEGYRQLDGALARCPRTGAAATDLTAAARVFLDFCVADLPRYQLMFTKVLPGWEPSPEAYATSRASYEKVVEWLAELGITDEAAIDLWSALTGGLAAQQVANDPGGDRWIRLVDDAVDLFLSYAEVTR